MPTALTVTSKAFKDHAAIPREYTCDGPDISPPFSIAGTPQKAKSLAIIVDDPDAPDPAAPKKVWVHWVAYDLPPTQREIATSAGNPPRLGRPGKNDWGTTEYRGPCPPVGKHRYFVKVFALDTELGDRHEPTKAELLRAMQGHVVAQGELVGTYQKEK